VCVGVGFVLLLVQLSRSIQYSVFSVQFSASVRFGFSSQSVCQRVACVFGKSRKPKITLEYNKPKEIQSSTIFEV